MNMPNGLLEYFQPLLCGCADDLKIRFMNEPVDDRALDILQYLFQISSLVTSGDQSFFQAKVSLSMLCEYLFSEQPSLRAECLHFAQNCMEQLLTASIEIIALNGGAERIHIIDRAAYECRPEAAEDKQMELHYEIQFGRTISVAILSYKMSLMGDEIIYPAVDQAVIGLYRHMQRERMCDLYLDDQTDQSFSLIFMRLTCCLNRMAGKSMILRYSEILGDMKNKRFCIEEFHFFRNQFLVRWIPLSDEERKKFEMIRNGVCCNGAKEYEE